MDIFTALADPNSRHLIELLSKHGPQSIKQLSMDANIGSQAITKHLNILVKAKLVNTEFVGKQRIHKLSPKPIQKRADWLQPYAQQWDTRLKDLQQHLGKKR